MLNFQTLWTTEDVATFCKVSTRQVRTWREQGTGPAYRTLGAKAIRYAPAEVINWTKAQQTNTTIPADPTGN